MQREAAKEKEKEKQEVKCVYCKHWLNNPTVILICWRFSRADVGLAGASSWLYCTCSFGANMEITQKSHCFFVDIIVRVCIFAVLPSTSLRFLGFILTHLREGEREGGTYWDTIQKKYDLYQLLPDSPSTDFAKLKLLSQ